MPSSSDGWVVTPKEAPAELAEGYAAPPFTPEQVAAEYTAVSEQRPDPTSLRTDTDWVPLEEKLDAAGMALLMRFGAIGDPNGNAGTTT